jgi:hypothetical protein
VPSETLSELRRIAAQNDRTVSREVSRVLAQHVARERAEQDRHAA